MTGISTIYMVKASLEGMLARTDPKTKLSDFDQRVLNDQVIRLTEFLHAFERLADRHP